jgi:hypothetical protein
VEVNCENLSFQKMCSRIAGWRGFGPQEVELPGSIAPRAKVRSPSSRIRFLELGPKKASA